MVRCVCVCRICCVCVTGRVCVVCGVCVWVGCVVWLVGEVVILVEVFDGRLGRIAQSVERSANNAVVLGSSPSMTISLALSHTSTTVLPLIQRPNPTRFDTRLHATFLAARCHHTFCRSRVLISFHFVSPFVRAVFTLEASVDSLHWSGALPRSLPSRSPAS